MTPKTSTLDAGAPRRSTRISSQSQPLAEEAKEAMGSKARAKRGAENEDSESKAASKKVFFFGGHTPCLITYYYRCGPIIVLGQT
jgi:hypothetical protein